jgi:hypothetical protein
MVVCVLLFWVCVVLCVGSGLETGWYPVRGVLPTVYRIKKLKSGQCPNCCRAIEREGVGAGDRERRSLLLMETCYPNSWSVIDFWYRTLASLLMWCIINAVPLCVFGLLFFNRESCQDILLHQSMLFFHYNTYCKCTAAIVTQSLGKQSNCACVFTNVYSPFPEPQFQRACSIV